MRTAAPPTDLEQQLDRHRGELTAHCLRMLGSAADADDAVQETLIRAWRGLGRLEHRGALRSWLYRIATNVCADMRRGSARRVVPTGLAAPGRRPSPGGGPGARAGAGAGGSDGGAGSGPARGGGIRFAGPADVATDPAADGSRVVPPPTESARRTAGDPGDATVAHDEVRRAFGGLLTLLPRRQRAVVVLCDVLRWTSADAAELLGTTPASVNSARQRARATLATPPRATVRPAAHGEVERYAEALRRDDVAGLVALLRA
jgi:RNA polymerase sigma-70 factor (ECF subfamily)